MRRGTLALSLLIALLAAASSAANDDAPTVKGVRVGFAGQYKAGLFAPVEVTLRGGRQKMIGTLEVVVPDGDGMPVRYLAPGNAPVQILPGETARIRLYARFGGIGTTLKVRFRVDGQVVASSEYEAGFGGSGFGDALDTGQRLYLATGARGRFDLEMLNDESPSLKKQGIRAATLDDVGQLCNRWYGYEGVDTLVMFTSQPDWYRQLTPDSPILSAIDQWVRMGGTLVLVAGAEADGLLQPGMPLSRFVPGKFDKIVSLAQTGAWESLADSKDPVPGVEPGRPMQVARLRDVRGVVDAREGDLPLVVRAAHGFGQVVFVAADLDAGPLARWKGRKSLLARLLDVPAAEKGDRRAYDVRPSPYGVVDLAGQLTKALCNFPHVKMVPFWVVALLLVAYVALIGPGDYFLLAKVIRRMEFTWLTFPAIVVAVSVGAYFAAYWLKGSAVRVSQADLIDVDVTERLVRGTTWAEIFSPRSQSYNLTLTPRLPDGSTPAKPDVLLSWMGLPGDALGGMSRRTQQSGVWSREYQAAPDVNAVAGMPIQVWSTKSVTARWSAPAGKTPTAELTDRGPFLAGKIENTLPVDLADCWLVYRSSAYDLGVLRAGQTATVGSSTSRSELKALLTHRAVVKEEERKYSVSVQPYDASSRQVPDILQAMMFYRAAGGLPYTHLLNGYQSFVDASALLKTDRAVLIARQSPNDTTRRGARLRHLERDLGANDDVRVTMFRFVFPVTRISTQP